MSVIYKTTDKIPVKVHDLTFDISPLTSQQKEEIQNEFLSKRVVNATKLAIKYAVKGIKGATLVDGSPYGLSFESGTLTDECVDELLNMGYSTEISLVCSQLVAGIPDKIVDDQGKPVKGIKILKPADLGN